mmetsp:Transcript_17373/g.25204  ORF Transcript_17373/g.25204 Transcript_17373/m.25204 type:complete len:452 (+) Transcript_17373:93-1448(+)
MGRIPKRKTERAPPIDKLLKPAIGIGLAILGYYFFQGIQSEIPRIDIQDELAVREVFFGEGESNKDYVVLCHVPPGNSGSVTVPISSVFQEASADAASPGEFVLMDCTEKLPSGKTVAERFSLDLKKRPTIFVSGKVGPPKQIPTKHLKTGAMLTKVLKQLLEPHAAKIETTKDLKAKCLNKDVCGLLLKGGKPEPYVKDAVSNLLVKYPKVQFASVDSTVLYMSNLEEYLPEFKSGEHRFVVFKKVSGGLDAGTNETAGSGRLITSIAPLQSNGVSFSSMSSLVNNAVKGSSSMKKIPSLPAVKTRTRKLEEAERKKRQRKMDQSNRSSEKQQGSSTGGGGAFSANDGSKEGRKMERDKRREEHRKQNNVKPKTPEEIAEMERARRQRMEEEAAKWNIAPEDAPEEGDFVDDEESSGGGYYFNEDEDEDGFVDADEDEEEEDDEDVLDLD